MATATHGVNGMRYRVTWLPLGPRYGIGAVPPSRRCLCMSEEEQTESAKKMSGGNKITKCQQLSSICVLLRPVENVVLNNSHPRPAGLIQNIMTWIRLQRLQQVARTTSRCELQRGSKNGCVRTSTERDETSGTFTVMKMLYVGL